MSIYQNFDGSWIDSFKQITSKTIDNNIEYFNSLMEIVYWAKSYRESIFCYRRKITEPPICELPGCNIPTEFKNKRYKQFCSIKHSRMGETFIRSHYNKETRDKIKNTNLERYGSVAPSGNKEISRKIDQTNMKRYGSRSPAENDKVKQKIAKTNLERYGHISPLLNEEIDQKRTATLIERYNVENHYEIPGMYDRVLNTMIERYGDHNLIADCFQNNIRDTFKSKYGVEYTLQSKELRNKGLCTLSKRYNIDYTVYNVMDIPEIANKALNNSFHMKDYATIDSKQIRIMGYEGYAYDYLYNVGFRNIKYKRCDVGSIRYFNTTLNRETVYYPDIRISNTFVEVKSNWTLSTSYMKYIDVYDNTSMKLIIIVWDKSPENNKPTIINSKKQLLQYIAS